MLLVSGCATSGAPINPVKNDCHRDFVVQRIACRYVVNPLVTWLQHLVHLQAILIGASLVRDIRLWHDVEICTEIRSGIHYFMRNWACRQCKQEYSVYCNKNEKTRPKQKDVLN